jgi:hypothetical protein
MDPERIEGILLVAETGLATGRQLDLGAVGFWKAVNAVKQQPDLVEVFGDRIGVIDRLAFERWALLTMPSRVGTALSVGATAAGLALVGRAYRLEGAAQGLALLTGTGVVLTATHGLAHWVVARSMGMQVSHWFVGSVRKPHPGVKVDYSSYLRTPARSRAWMHASGAILSKLVPFLGLGAGRAMKAPRWAQTALGAIAIVQIVTDVLWSTKASDWKKFNREMALAGGR